MDLSVNIHPSSVCCMYVSKLHICIYHAHRGFPNLSFTEEKAGPTDHSTVSTFRKRLFG